MKCWVPHGMRLSDFVPGYYIQYNQYVKSSYNSDTVYLTLTLHLFLFCPLLGVLPSTKSIFSFTPSPTDCVEAHRVCSADPQCEALYRGLELCAADAEMSPLGDQAAAECLEGQDALLTKHPSLSSCKCQRGFRKEEQCLRIYWRVRLLPGQSGLCWGLWCEGHAWKCIWLCLFLSIHYLRQSYTQDSLPVHSHIGSVVCDRLLSVIRRPGSEYLTIRLFVHFFFFFFNIRK